MKTENRTVSEIILHIPHSSTRIPGECRRLFFLKGPALRRELLRMTDAYTDVLFCLPGLPVQNRAVFPYSRLVCDVERFRDDAQEPMAARGMGVCYTAASDLRPLKAVPPEHRQAMLALYDRHHAGLTAAVDRSLARMGAALVIDCHSFASRRLPYETAPETARRPDICIGTDPDFHTPGWLAACLCSAFAEKGYTVAVNEPFGGTLVPMKHYCRDSRVLSAMIEVNRGLYMDEETGLRSRGFAALQADIRDVLEGLTARLAEETGIGGVQKA